MQALGSSKMLVIYIKLYGVILKMTAFLTLTSAKTSNLTMQSMLTFPNVNCNFVCDKYCETLQFSDLQTVSSYVIDIILTNTVSNTFHHLPKVE